MTLAHTSRTSALLDMAAVWEGPLLCISTSRINVHTTGHDHNLASELGGGYRAGDRLTHQSNNLQVTQTHARTDKHAHSAGDRLTHKASQYATCAKRLTLAAHHAILRNTSARCMNAVVQLTRAKQALPLLHLGHHRWLVIADRPVYRLETVGNSARGRTRERKGERKGTRHASPGVDGRTLRQHYMVAVHNCASVYQYRVSWLLPYYRWYPVVCCQQRQPCPQRWPQRRQHRWWRMCGRRRQRRQRCRRRHGRARWRC